MPVDNYNDCVKRLGEAQEADKDNREQVREADHFLNKRDGQWDPGIVNIWSGKPRYTFDECNPIVDDIMGEMESMEFAIDVDPAGGEASKDLANAYEGLIRNIEAISGARHIYNAAARIMIGTGLSGWRVVTDWCDDDSFQQDLLIKSVPTFEDSVWFDPDSTEQDGSDADHCWVLTSMTKARYKKKYPKGSGASVGTDLGQQTYFFKKNNEVILGEYLYRVKSNRVLLLLSDDRIVEAGEEFESIRDELFASGITVVRERTRPYHTVHQKVFDGSDWLGEAKATVFNYIPIIPVYGNFKISENKIVYWGAIEKLMDAQRVINYTGSRNVEEVALGPKEKTFMTTQQAKSSAVRQTLQTMNTNNNPVQLYDHVDGHPPPYKPGPNQPNMALTALTGAMSGFIERSSGTYRDARGDAPDHRSGEAIDKLQKKSDNPKRKWFTAMEIALTHTCRILIQAIPRVYDTTQERRIVNPDKTTDTFTIREKVFDEQTGRVVEINDLSKGKYDVAVSAGPAFQSRQQEAVEAIQDISSIDPSIVQIGSDILLNNIPAPGVDKIAERKRLQMVKAGLIPEDQLTEEEKVMVASQQNQGVQDPMMVAAQAEMIKAQTEAETKAMKLEIEQSKIALKQMEMQLRAQNDQSKTMIDSIKAMTEQAKQQAITLKAIREAMGVEAIISPNAAAAFEGQAVDLLETIKTN